MTILQELLPLNPRTRPGVPLFDVKALVFHWTGVPNQSVRKVWEFYATRDDGWGGAHYGIDAGETLRMVPENELVPGVGGKCLLSWLDGEPWHGYSRQNALTINIEMVPMNAEGEHHGYVLAQAIDLGRRIVERYGLGSEQVLRHYDVTGKVCPKWFVDHDGDWQAFKHEIVGRRRGRILP